MGAFSLLPDGTLAVLEPRRTGRRGKHWVKRKMGAQNLKPSETFLAHAPEKLREAVATAYDYTDPIDPRTVAETVLEPGAYYPRIWRGRYVVNNPLFSHRLLAADEDHGLHGRAFNQSVVAATNLFDALTSLFRVVEPVDGNRKVYGHQIRDLLILSCTEVEANWRSILLANFPTNRERLGTSDYVKLAVPLALAAWSADLVHYGDFSALSPFGEWDPLQPTKSLPWYDAYNAVKHDREENFARATLENVIASMCALHIIISAQWGPEVFDRWHDGYRSPFHLAAVPDCGPKCYALPPLDCESDEKVEWRQTRYADQPDHA